MAYTPTQWQTGDTITETLLNKIEQGIYANSLVIDNIPSELLALYPTDTASGAVASFSDGAEDVPVKSLSVSIDPVQDLHGYDSPWVGGAGQNKMPYPTARDATFQGVRIVSDGKGTITMTGTCTRDDYGSYPLDEAFTIPDGSAYKVCFLNTQALSNNTDIGFYNGATLVDSWTVNTVKKESGYSAMSNKTCDRVRVYVRNGMTYNCTLQIMFVPQNANSSAYIPYENICPISGHTQAVVTRTGEGGADSEQYTISLDGTRYGGQLDVTNGVLTVTHGMVDLGSLTWTKSSAGDGKFYSSQSTTPQYKTADNTEMVCSNYKFDGVGSGARGYFGDNGTLRYYHEGTSPAKELYVHDSAKADMTAAQFKTAMDGVTLVYELATPTTVQLTPTEVTTLLGDNNIFCSTGDTEVTYRADMGLFIKKLVENL